MAIFTLTPGIDNFTGLAGENNFFDFTSADLQATDTITGGATGSFIDALRITAAGTIAASQFASVTNVEELLLSSGGNNVTLTNGLIAGTSIGYFAVADGTGNDTVDASGVSNGIPVAFFSSGGTDIFKGGNGNDAFVVATADLAGDTIQGGTGIDNLYLSTGGTVAAAAFTNVSAIEGLVLSAAGNDVTLTNALVASSNNGTFAVAGGAGDDTVDASGVNNGIPVAFFSNGGNDTFKGSNGVNGFVFAAADLTSADTVQGGSAIDNLYLSTAGTVSAAAFTNVTAIEGLVLTNGTNNVTLTDGLIAGTSIGYFAVAGGTGNDTVDASGVTNGTPIAFYGTTGGNDTFTGGIGNDSFLFGAAGSLSSLDTVVGGAGNDTLWMTANITVNTGDLAGVSGIEGVFQQSGGTFNFANGLTGTSNLAAVGSSAVDTFNGAAVTGYSLTMTGNGGADVMTGGSGDDAFNTPDSAFASINGNGGLDRIVLTTPAQSFNLTANNAKITNTEIISLSSSAAASLTLAGTDIPLVNAGTKLLYVVGEADDAVTAGSGWFVFATNVVNNAVATGHSFTDYQHNNGSHLFIDSTITPSITLNPNTPPTLGATGVNPGFTENGSVVDLFSTVSASTVEAGQNLDRLVLTVTNIAGTGATESLAIDGTTVALTNGNSQITATNGMTAAVVLAAGTATVTISKAGGISAAAMQTLVDALAYGNTSDDPGAASRVVTLTSLRDTGGTAGGGNDTATLNLQSTVAVTPVNDEPTLSATALNPAFTENGSVVDLFSTVTASTVEAGQTLDQLVLTVTNIAGTGATESLAIDGTTVALTNGNSQITATNGMTAAVVLAAGTATVTISKAGGISAAAMQTLVDALAYGNTSDDPGAASRVVTLTSLRDTGSNVSPNDNIAALNIASTVAVTPVNDNPVIDLLATGGVQTTGTTATFDEAAGPPVSAVTVLPQLTLSDVDSANLTGATVTLNNAQTGDVVTVSGFGGTSGNLGTGIHFDITGGNTVTFSNTDTLADYQAALRLVQFNNTTENPVTVVRHFDVQVNDGSGANNLGNATADVTVIARNDAPVNTVPTDASLGTAMSNTDFAVSGITISDVDANAGLLHTTLSVTNGTVAVTLGGSGATISGGASGTATVTLQGTVAQINAALANNVIFHSTDGFAGQANLTVSTDDQGNTGTSPPGAQTDTDVIHIGVIPQVFIIDNTPPGAGNNGSLTDPFNSINSFNTSANDGSGDYIYIRSGTYSEADGINLLSNEQLFGEGQTLSFTNPVNGAIVTIGTGSAALTPTISVTGANQHGIDLGANNRVTGLNVATTLASQTAIDDGGNNVGALLISDVDISGVGKAIDIDQGGTLVALTIDSLESTGSATEAVDLEGVGGTFTALASTISGAGGGSIKIVGGTLSATFGGNITQNLSGAAVLVSGGHATGTITFQTGTINATAGSGLQFDNADGIYNFNGTTTLNGGDAGIDITNGSTGTFSFGTGTAITNPSGTSFTLSNSNANVTYSGSISDNTGLAVDIDNHDLGTITFQTGSITSTGSGITVQNSAGTETFNNPTISLTTGASSGATLSSNTGGTINFTPAAGGNGLDISTTSGTGFSATGGGTVTVTGTGNTISSTTGTALNIANTTIGANDVTFQSISSNGAVNGIVLNNTGTTASFGGLIVTGDGTTNVNGSGGTITNSTGAGISLTNTRDVSLDQMNITNGGDDGIHGVGVVNFTLNRSNVTGNGNSTADDGIQFGEASGTVVGVTGTVQILNSSVSGNAHNGVHIRNTSGTIDNLTVTGSTFNDVNDTFGANAFLFEASGTSTTTEAFITGSTFSNNTPQRALEVQSHDTATISDFVVSGNIFTNNGIHASFTQDTSSNLEFYFVNNGTVATPMTGSILQAVNVFSSSQSTGGTIVGTIQGNRVGTTQAGAITAVIQGQTDATLLIDGNIITGTNGDSRAISVAFRGPAPPLATTLGANTVVSDVTITNNTVTPGAAPSGFPLGTIVVEADNQSGADNKAPTVRADIRGNTVPTTPVFDLVDAHIIFYEYDAAGGHGIGQLVNTTGAATADQQLDNTNTGTVGSFGISLIAGPINVPPSVPTPLLAALGGVEGSSNAPGETHVTQAQLDSIVAAAIAHWAAAGLSAAQLAVLQHVTYDVADITPGWLGASTPGHVTIDDDAAGHGWFIDPTPGDNVEFTHAASATHLTTDPTEAPAGHMDLLTAVMHEMGEQLGLVENYDPAAHDDLMYVYLTTGERRLPDASDTSHTTVANTGGSGNDARHATADGSAEGPTGGTGADPSMSDRDAHAAATAKSPIAEVTDSGATHSDTIDVPALLTQLAETARDGVGVKVAPANASASETLDLAPLQTLSDAEASSGQYAPDIGASYGLKAEIATVIVPDLPGPFIPVSIMPHHVDLLV